MSLKGAERLLSTLVNIGTCPRPTTGSKGSFPQFIWYFFLIVYILYNGEKDTKLSLLLPYRPHTFY